MKITPRKADENGRMYALRILKQNIVDTTLAPGTLFSENELAAALGLSRVPVREALIELSQSEIIDILPQRGSRVALIDMRLVEESAFLRRTLECSIIRLACEKIKPEYLLELEANLNLQKFYIKNPIPDKMAELDNEFHRILFFCCGREHCYKTVSDIRIHYDRILSLALASVKELSLVSDHFELFSALSEHNPDKAEKLMVQHLDRYKIDAEAVKARYPEYFAKN